MTNQNKCETCEHKKKPDGGHCYMFRYEPTDVCYLHTGRNLYEVDMVTIRRILASIRND